MHLQEFNQAFDEAENDNEALAESIVEESVDGVEPIIKVLGVELADVVQVDIFVAEHFVEHVEQLTMGNEEVRVATYLEAETPIHLIDEFEVI